MPITKPNEFELMYEKRICALFLFKAHCQFQLMYFEWGELCVESPEPSFGGSVVPAPPDIRP